RYRFDGQSAVGTSLGHGGGDRVVRADLDRVARGTTAPEQAVDQDARAAAPVAIDEQARRPGAGVVDGRLKTLPFKTRVSRPVDQPLQSTIAGKQPHSRRQ